MGRSSAGVHGGKFDAELTDDEIALADQLSQNMPGGLSQIERGSRRIPVSACRITWFLSSYP